MTRIGDDCEVKSQRSCIFGAAKIVDATERTAHFIGRTVTGDEKAPDGRFFLMRKLLLISTTRTARCGLACRECGGGPIIRGSWPTRRKSAQGCAGRYPARGAARDGAQHQTAAQEAAASLCPLWDDPARDAGRLVAVTGLASRRRVLKTDLFSANLVLKIPAAKSFFDRQPITQDMVSFAYG